MTAVGSPGGDSAAAPPRVVVATSLDNLGSAHVRFLQEAARRGAVHARVPSDQLVESATGRPPRFPQAERLFLARSLRYVTSAAVVRRPFGAAVGEDTARFSAVVVPAHDADPGLRARCAARGLDYRVVETADLAGFPPFDDEGSADPGGARRVVVTGCFDWLHSGHIRFFMDAAAYGALYVVVGSDRNVELLKGPGHPQQHEEERRYMVGAVGSVHHCLVSSGEGWMDAEPEDRKSVV